MGMAHNAPMSTYHKTFYISVHVIEQMRGRIGDPHRENLEGSFIFRDGNDLKNRIDSALKSALSTGKYEDIVDRGDKAKLVIIEDWFKAGDPMFILVKEDYCHKNRLAAVTALTQDQVNENKRKNRWTIVSKNPIISSPINGLTPGAKPATREETIVFHYQTRDGIDHFEKYLKKEASARGRAIINRSDYKPLSLEAYGQLRDQIKFTS